MKQGLICFLLLILSSYSAYGMNNALLPQIRTGSPGTSVGEIISPTNRTEIAAWCDFSRQIVVVSQNVYLCSYNGKNGTE